MSLMSTEEATYDNNLKKLGYADPAKPGGIDIYPIDFESKEKVIEILDGYNDRMDGRRARRTRSSRTPTSWARSCRRSPTS